MAGETVVNQSGEMFCDLNALEVPEFCDKLYVRKAIGRMDHESRF
jgi:hypothetical protein